VQIENSDRVATAVGVAADGKYVDIDALTSRRARSCISI
jgi:hypothetical protein